MHRHFILLFFAMVSMGLTTACSLDASITSYAEKIEPPAEIVIQPRFTGITSGSSQKATAAESGVTYYQVQSSVGGYTSGLTQATQDGIYQVFSTLQGSLTTQQ